jgi:hypothetical protein
MWETGNPKTLSLTTHSEPMKFTEAQLEAAIIELLEAEGSEPKGFE